MKNLKKKISNAGKLVDFMQEKEWSAEEIAGAISILHLVISEDYSLDFSLSTLDTVE